MPRAFNTCSVRVRSPLNSKFDTSSQVSISDETPICVLGMLTPLSLLRLVNKAVICSRLRKSIRRISVGLSARSLSSKVRLLIGSTTTTAGWCSTTRSCICSRCFSSPCKVGRAAWISSRPRASQGARSTPIERMLRSIWALDSS